MKIIWQIPIKTVSEINSSEHWSAKSKRHRQQQFFVRAQFNRETQKIGLPCVVTLTRLAPRPIDTDNLPTSMKYVQDEIGACLFPDKVAYYRRKGKLIANKGYGDSDPRVLWQYAQEKATKQAVRIEISFDERGECA